MTSLLSNQTSGVSLRNVSFFTVKIKRVEMSLQSSNFFTVKSNDCLYNQMTSLLSNQTSGSYSTIKWLLYCPNQTVGVSLQSNDFFTVKIKRLGGSLQSNGFFIVKSNEVGVSFQSKWPVKSEASGIVFNQMTSFTVRQTVRVSTMRNDFFYRQIKRWECVFTIKWLHYCQINE
jgi:hypothetical protein